MAKAKSTETKEEPSTNDYAESFFKENAEDLFNHIVPLNKPITSGSLLLDQYIKVRSGGVVRIAAKLAESGKSSQSLVFADNFMKTMPKSKTAFFMAEGRLSQELRDRSGLKFVWHPKDWEYGTVLIIACNVFEKVANFIIKQSKVMFEAGEKLCIIVDSLDGLILKSDKETKGISGDGKVAGVPKLTKLLFRHVALPITFYDILLILTSQFSTDISLDPYAPKQVKLSSGSGGNAVPHQCDYILEYEPRYGGDFILENSEEKPDPVKNKILGVWATVSIKKSATDTSGTKIKIPIKKGRIGCAIWIEKEVVDLALQYDIVKRSGAWFSFDPAIIKEAAADGVTIKEKIQGLASVYEYIEQDKAVFEWLLAKFKKILNNE